MGKVSAAGAALVAMASVLAGCDRSGSREEHETAAAPNMVEVGPAAPANVTQTRVVKSAAVAPQVAADGDSAQIDEDAAAVGMTSRRSTSTTTTTTLTTSTGPAAAPASSAPPAP